MNFFDYRGAILHVAIVPMPAIADAVGTPVHVYSAGAIHHTLNAL